MTWLVLEHCTIGDLRHRIVEDLTWTWKAGESWLVTGPNGSGKSALVALWLGHLDAVDGRFACHPYFADAEDAWIGFERQKLLLERERYADDSDYRESPDPGTLVATFVGSPELLERFGLGDKGDRGLKHLSTGEMRRACLARAWARGLPFLLCDEPAEGLDVAGQALIRELLAQTIRQGTDVVLLTQRAEAAPRELQLQWTLPGPGNPAPTQAPFTETARFPAPHPATDEAVLEFHRVEAGYGDLVVLKDLEWTVRRGERWLVTGPNGSGKSTLMALICGDHPHVFRNDITLFGKRRGPELTLDDVRRRVAVVSYAHHLRFRNLQRSTGLDVLASGFPGTVGLWELPAWHQVQACRQLAAEWGLEEASHQQWDDLSWGTQRLFLLGRALVAGQDLLLLDEPCQGLDARAQERFIARVAQWCRDPARTLVYVTHRAEEIDATTFQRLVLSS